MDDLLWTQDLYILLDKERLVEFFPTQDMSTEEKVNSIVRFLIYMGALTSYLKKNAKPAVICCILIFIVTFIFYPNMQKSRSDLINNYNALQENERLEISQNPYENPLPMSRPSEYGINVGKPAFRTESDREADVYRDLHSVGKTDGNNRSFYTVPDINIPNNRKDYMNFMYGNTASQKDWFN